MPESKPHQTNFWQNHCFVLLKKYACGLHINTMGMECLTVFTLLLNTFMSFCGWHGGMVVSTAASQARRSWVQTPRGGEGTFCVEFVCSPVFMLHKCSVNIVYLTLRHWAADLELGLLGLPIAPSAVNGRDRIWLFWSIWGVCVCC